MLRKPITGGIILLFLLSSLIPIATSDSSTLNNIIYVDDDNIDGPWDGSLQNPYNIIQYAIENASNGDTVFVYSGIYSDYFPENYACVKITKSINLVGEDKNNTIILGHDYKYAVNLVSDNVSITGFMIQPNHGRSRGIAIWGENNYIADNIIKNASFGICIGEGYQGIDYRNNTIDNNIFIENYGGLLLYGCSKNNTVINNNFISNGISVGSNGNIISGNYLFNKGMSFGHSAYKNVVTDNFIDNKPIIYYGGESNITIDNESAGQIIIIKCENITIKNQQMPTASIDIKKTNNLLVNNCTIRKVYWGHSSNITIRDNNIVNSGIGTGGAYSKNIIISGNNISNCSKGIYHCGGSVGSVGLKIYQNTITGNDRGIDILYPPANITNNIIKNNDIGIYANMVYDCIISNNIISDNRKGIVSNIYRSKIYENTINNNSEIGISLKAIYGKNNNNNSLNGNNIFNNGIGISLYSSLFNMIIDNNISNNNDIGILLGDNSRNTTILHNNISKNNNGIYCYSPLNTISLNNITNNIYGISMEGNSGKNVISINSIMNNDEYGIYLQTSSYNLITCNNFVKNKKNSYFIDCDNITWNENYWDRPRFLPYLIFGTKSVPRLINDDKSYSLPWINIDWHPAKEPYDIL